MQSVPRPQNSGDFLLLRLEVKKLLSLHNGTLNIARYGVEDHIEPLRDKMLGWRDDARASWNLAAARRR